MSTGFHPFDSHEGGHVRTLTAELAASQTYEAGDILSLTAAQLTVKAAASKVAAAEFLGVASEPATGQTAASRALLTGAPPATSRLQPAVEADFGAVAGIGRGFYLATTDTLYTCRRYYTAISGTTEADFNPNSATLGLWQSVQVGKPTGGEFGLVAVTADVSDGDLGAQIVALLDENGQRVLSTAADVTAAVRAAADVKKPYRFLVRFTNLQPTLLDLASMTA